MSNGEVKLPFESPIKSNGNGETVFKPWENWKTKLTTATAALVLGTTMLGNVAQQTITLGAGDATFAVTSNVVTITGDAGGNSITTITGASPGLYAFIFVDANVTFVDDDGHGANTIDLNGNQVGADDKVIGMVFDGTSWYKSSASAN